VTNIMLVVYVFSLFLGDFLISGFYPGLAASVLCLFLDANFSFPLKLERLLCLFLFILIALFVLDSGVNQAVPFAWLAAGMTLSWPFFFNNYALNMRRSDLLLVILLPLLLSFFSAISLERLLSVAGRNNLYRIVLSSFVFAVTSVSLSLLECKQSRIVRFLWPFSLILSLLITIYIVVALGSRFGILLLFPSIIAAILALWPSSFSFVSARSGISLSFALNILSKSLSSKVFYLRLLVVLGVLSVLLATLSYIFNQFASDRIIRYWQLFAESASASSSFSDVIAQQSINRLNYYQLALDNISLFGVLSPSTFNPHNFLVDLSLNYGILFFGFYLFSLYSFLSSGLISIPVKLAYLIILLSALSSGYIAENFPLLAVVPFGLNRLFCLLGISRPRVRS